MAIRFLKLTSSRIAALAAGSQLQENGIIVARLPNGDLRWSINTMVDGERIHRVIGTESGGVGRHSAEVALETLRTQARESRLRLPVRRKLCKTFAVAAAEYLDRITREDAKNLEHKERNLRLHLVPKLGSLPINKISEERCAAYRKDRRAEGAKDTTINREFATLSNFFKCATHKKWKWMSADDVPDIVFTPEPKLPFKVLSGEELQRLFEGAAKHGEQALLFVAMMAGAPLRCNEVLPARFEHIHDTKPQLFLPKAKTGARHQRISEELWRLLLRLRWEHQQKTGSRNGWLFPAPREQDRKAGRHRGTYKKVFRSCVIDAELDPAEVTPYTLRRTTITDLAGSGIDLAGLMELTCHKTPESVLRYVQTRDEDKTNAMKVLDRNLTPDAAQELHQAEISPNDNPDGGASSK